MGVKKTEKKIKSLLSSIIHPPGAVISSLSILPVILAKWPDAYYIDPGTVGMIIQGLVGVAIGALAMGVIFRRRVTDWVKYKFKRSDTSGDEEDTESALPTEPKSESDE